MRAQAVTSAQALEDLGRLVDEAMLDYRRLDNQTIANLMPARYGHLAGYQAGRTERQSAPREPLDLSGQVGHRVGEGEDLDLEFADRIAGRVVLDFGDVDKPAGRSGGDAVDGGLDAAGTVEVHGLSPLVVEVPRAATRVELRLEGGTDGPLLVVVVSDRGGPSRVAEQLRSAS